MKRLLFAFLLAFPLALLAQQQNYVRVHVFPDGKSTQQLSAAGIEFTTPGKADSFLTAEIPETSLKTLQAVGFRYEVVIPDLTSWYRNRFKQKSALSGNDLLLSQEWPDPLNFSLGSCGGFSTLDEMLAQLDLMRSLYPDLVSVKQALSDTITTIEGRPVYWVRISDHPDLDESEPEVLYTGMHHAREPIGMQHLLYYMWYLLENYSTDPSVKALVDQTEMYFVPVFNVDGYTYNITTNPGGGGMWRKNRRNSGNGNYGVDVNRNYGYQWGYDDSGSSPDPSSDLYRGTAAFSEPETRMMKYFCENHDFRIALNYHSYSGLFLYAWGWTPILPPDHTLLSEYALTMTRENGYATGPGNTTIYPTNGGSDDWMYGEQTSKPVILSYTPEVGTNTDGFWPIQDRIMPLIRENMYASITAARLAGNYGTISDNSDFFLSQQSGFLPFTVKRLGMENGTFTVSVVPLGDAFISVGEPVSLSGIAQLGTGQDSISFQLSGSLNAGDTVRYLLALDCGGYTRYDTVTRVFGYALPLFSDALNSASSWTGSWAISSEQYFSPSSSMTDSPNGNYSPGANKITTTVSEITLPAALKTVLEYRARWSLEKDFDYVQLSISTNNGTTWTPLQGQYTHAGGPYQASGQPLYDGTEAEWRHEVIALDTYQGKKIKLRFRLKADMGTQLDGFWFDDVKVSMLLDPTGLQTDVRQEILMGEPWPNPAGERIQAAYALPAGATSADVSLFSPLGIRVRQQQLSGQAGTVQFETRGLAPGIYTLRIQAPGIPKAVRRVVID
jgi:carboxypeptidase T